MTRGETMSIREVVNSMLTIEERLWRFEKKYGLKSADFYRLVKSGQLGDMDGRNDMTDWRLRGLVAFIVGRFVGQGAGRAFSNIFCYL